MVYFLGDWGMGDSDCASYHQHVPNTIHQQQNQQFHHHQHEQQLQQLQQQHVGQVAPTLNQLSPLQFGSTTGSTTFLSHNSSVTPPIAATGTATSASTPLLSQVAVATTQQPQHVATSSLVTANLQQLSVSSNNLKSLATSINNSTSNSIVHPLQQQQQQPKRNNNQVPQSQQPPQSHPLASAAAALHQYLGHHRQRSESCAGLTTNSGAIDFVRGKHAASESSATNVSNKSCTSNFNLNTAVLATQQQQTYIQQQQTSQQHHTFQTQLSKDHLESEDEVALQPLSNQVS